MNQRTKEGGKERKKKRKKERKKKNGSWEGMNCYRIEERCRNQSFCAV